MPIKIKTQKDHLLTEVSIELPTDLNSLDKLMKLSKATGKIVAIYNQGGLMQVNLDQKSPVPEKSSEEIREILGVTTKEME